MSPRDMEIAESLTFALSDAMCQRVPALFAVPPEVVAGMALPLACGLVRLERKARRNRKHARKYRKAKDHVRALLSVPLLPGQERRPEPVADQALPAPGGLVPFEPAAWRTALVPVPRPGDLR